MFGMSMTEVMIILVVALLVLGPNELPKAARTLGKTLRDVRKASDDLRDTFEREVMSEKAPPKPRPPEGEQVSATLPPPETTNAPPASNEPSAPAAPAAAPEGTVAASTAATPLAGLELGPDPFAVADAKDRA